MALTEMIADREVEAAKFSVTDFPTYYIWTIQAMNMNHLNHVLRPLGISTVHWRILAILQESNGQNIGYLAARLVVDRSNLGRMIDTLVDGGLVERREMVSDRRNSLIYMTDIGQQKVNQVFPEVKRLVDAWLDGFSDKEVSTFLDMLKRMKDNVSRFPDV
jgi:DNA-binding MarR family transcriptional regulator